MPILDPDASKEEKKDISPNLNTSLASNNLANTNNLSSAENKAVVVHKIGYKVGFFSPLLSFE